MNFLLHRHFASSELDSAAAGVGAMLPDLWRMADRRMRARAREDLVRSADPLDQGVHHHIEADTWFHRTDVFRSGERELARALASVEAPKLVLFAHAAWEMCLDGALLLDSDFQGALDELRTDMGAAVQTMAEVADLHGAQALADRRRFLSRMDRLLEGLLTGRWIGSYRTGDGLAQCVGGMRRRFSLPPLGEEEESLVACLLEEALERAREALPELHASRREHLARRDP